MAVYQDEEEKNRSGISNDDLRHITGINREQEGAHDREAHRGATEDIGAREAAAIRPTGPTGASLGALGAAKAGESAGAAGPGGLSNMNDKLGKGFTGAAGAVTPEGKATELLKKGLDQLWGTPKRRRNTLLSGGGLTGGIVSVAIVMFTIQQQVLIQMVAGAQTNDFKTAQSNTQEWLDKKLSLYLSNRVYARLGPGCKTSAELAKCIPKNESAKDTAAATDPDKAAMDALDDQGLAKELAERGTTFSEEGGRKLATFTDDAGKKITVDITKALASGSLMSDPAFANAAGGKALDALQSTTNRIFAPFGSLVQGRLLDIFFKTKGILPCLMLCKPDIDPSKTSAVDQENFAKAADDIVNRAAAGSTEEAIVCLMSECNPTERPEPKPGSDLNSEPVNKYQQATDDAVKKAIGDTQAKVTSGDKAGLEAAEKEASELEADASEKSFSNFVARYMSDGAAKTFGAAFTKSIGSYLKLAGAWETLAIQLAAKTIKFIAHAGTYGRAMNFTVRAAPYLARFMQTATASSEQKHGKNVSQKEIGSLANNYAGGGSVAYSHYLQPNTSPVSAENVHKYLVKSGFSMTDITAPLITASDTANKYHIGAIVPLANFVDTIITKGTEPLAWFIQHIPGVNAAMKAATSWVPGLMQYLITAGFGLPNFTHLTAEGKTNQFLGGGVVAASLTGKSMGGHFLTPKQAKKIGDAQEKRNMDAFQKQPLFARLFSFSTPYSLASRMAIAMPTTIGLSFTTASRSIASTIVTNPFGRIFGGFSTIFGSMVHADQPAAADPFGVPTIGLLSSDIDANYWTEHAKYCEQQEKDGWPDWVKSFRTDDASGQQVPTKPNKCLTNKQLDCAMFEPPGISNRPKTLQHSPCPANNDTQTDTATIAGAKIDMANLYKDSTGVGCAGLPNKETKDLGTQTGYTNGKPVPIKICAIIGFRSTGEESNNGYGVKGAGGNVVVNSRVSGAVLAMFKAAKADGLTLDAISSFRSMAHQKALCPCDGIHVAHPGNSNHQMGLAIDFGGGLPSTPGPIAGNKFWSWLSKNAGTYGYKNYPAEAWHWSPTGH